MTEPQQQRTLCFATAMTPQPAATYSTGGSSVGASSQILTSAILPVLTIQ